MLSYRLKVFPFSLVFSFLMLFFFLLNPFRVSLAESEPDHHAFLDVQSTDYYHAAVNLLRDDGFIDKVSHYRPADPVTRAEMAKLITLFAKLSMDASGNPFQDVPLNEWFTHYVDTLYTYDLAKGYIESGQHYFKPSQFLTREEMVVFMDRILISENSVASSFSDVPHDHWAKEAIDHLVAAEVIEGKGNNLFGLGEPINRADLAVILNRAAKHGLKPLFSVKSISTAPFGGDGGGTGEIELEIEVIDPDETGVIDKKIISSEKNLDCNGAPIHLSGSLEARIVCFPGPDGLTLRGFLYKSEGYNLPTVIVQHGSGGVYHSGGAEVQIEKDNSTELYAEGIGSNLDEIPLLFREQGGLGLLVDSFTPRGYDPNLHDKSQRPENIEMAKDAQFAKAFLNALVDEQGQKTSSGNFALVGYSHGGGAITLSSIQNGSPFEPYRMGPEFKYYANYYGGCGKIFDIEGDALYKNRAPIHFFHGSKDSIKEHCPRLMEESMSTQSTNLQMTYYEGADHGFFYKEDNNADIEAKKLSLIAIKSDFDQWLETSFLK